MKFLTAALAALCILVAPLATASTLSSVDHPDIPNCTLIGPNAPDCETIWSTKPLSEIKSGQRAHPKCGPDGNWDKHVEACVPKT